MPQLVLLLIVLVLVVVYAMPHESSLRPRVDDLGRARLGTELMERPCEVCQAGHCEDCQGPPCVHWLCFCSDKNADPMDYDLN